MFIKQLLHSFGGLSRVFSRHPLGFACASALFLSACSTPLGSAGGGYFKTPTVALTSLMPKALNGDNIAFDVGLSVHNPNVIAMPIDSIESTIALNGLSLISASGTLAKPIPPGGTENVTLSTAVKLSQFRQLLSTFNGTVVNYQLNGQVGVMGTGVKFPIQQSGQVDAVQLATQLLSAQR